MDCRCLERFFNDKEDANVDEANKESERETESKKERKKEKENM